MEQIFGHLIRTWSTGRTKMPVLMTSLLFLGQSCASWQEVVENQWKYRLESPTPTPDNSTLQTEVFSWVERGYKLIADWKYGFDGAGLFKGSNFSDPTQHRGSNNLVTTSTIPAELVAEKEMGIYVLTEILWQNSMANSPYATCPLRMTFEAESHANILLECDRQTVEKNTLRPNTIRLFDTQVTIHHQMLPTMNDGKVKYWVYLIIFSCFCYKKFLIQGKISLGWNHGHNEMLALSSYTLCSSHGYLWVPRRAQFTSISSHKKIFNHNTYKYY